MLSLTLSLLASVSAASPLPTDVSFPFQALPTARPGRVLELAVIPNELAVLTTLGDVRLVGVALPGGRLVDLELEAITLDPSDFGVQIDGVSTPYDPGDQSVWKGSVVGDDESNVMLSFSSLGSYGWIRTGGETTHVTSYADPQLGWAAPRTRLYDDALLDQGELNAQRCMAETLPNVTGAELHPASQVNVGLSAGCAELLTCPIAIETDFQLFQQFGDLNAMQTYITALLATISDVYVTNIGVELTFPYLQFYTTASDPWTSQDTNGASSGDVLGEFRNAWAGNIPAGASLAHFISGAGLGGGVAYVNALCNQDYGFGVSGNVTGGVNFPLTQGSGNWDFVVISHELGHNFASPHTHNYCPTPLDNCAPSGYEGACQTSIQCTPGTIMSYCHLCGGIGNIQTEFHPVVRDVMRTGAEQACLQLSNDADCDCDGIADVFEPDCDLNGIPDDCEGSVRGLTGQYYDNIDLTQLALTRVDSVVNFNWGSGSPAAGIGTDTFSVRWTGFLLPDESGIHVLRLTGDDGVRLWIDDALVIDGWVNQGPTNYDADVSLSAGSPVSVRIEYFENSGGTTCRFYWTPPSGTRTVVPSEHLVASAAAVDCNGNGVPDICDLTNGTLGATSEFGAGHPGSGGVVPQLAMDCVGVQSPLTLSVTNGLGGASGLVLIGPAQVSVPLFGGTLLAGPNYYSILPIGLNGTGAGSGSTVLGLSIPAPTSPGSFAYAQVGLFDAGASRGLALSRGLQVELPTQ